MSKCLILLTSEYPFGKAETFIESEIDYQAQHFEKIIILSIDLQKNAKKTRNVPSNAECYNITPIDKKIGRLGDLILGTASAIIPSEFYKSDKREINHNPFKRIFHEYFCHRAKREYKYCLNILNKYDFSKYDEVVIYGYWFFVTSLIGVMLKRKLADCCKSVKLISRCHSYDVYGELDPTKNLPMNNYLPMREYILENLDMLYPCSENAENFLKKRYPKYSDKIHHSYLGTLDCGVAENKKEKNKINLISCSGLVEHKRVDKIVDALELLDNSGLNISWTHIGSGALLQNIQQQAQDRLKNIKFDFIGQLPNQDVYKKYLGECYDLLINTSSVEGVPVSIMEAISFGTPVIATDVGGVGEIIQDDYNGKLLKKDFVPKELADYIKEFAVMDFEQIEVYRKNARKKWLKDFNASENYAEFSLGISTL